MTALPRHDWHAPILAALVNAYKTELHTPRYLEIGIDRGHTFSHVAEQTRAECWGVDITLSNILALNKITSMNNVRLWEEPSDKFFAGEGILNGDPFDVIFIDGDHSATQSWCDFFNALHLLSDNGVIAMHDTLPLKHEWAKSHCGTVYRTAQQLYDTLKTSYTVGSEPLLQIWTLPLFPGLTLVSKQHRPMR